MNNRSTRKSSTILPSIPAALLLLLVAGCGDDGGGTGANPTPTPTTVPPTAGASQTPTAAPTDTPPPSPTPPVPTATPGGELDISICAPDAGPFSAEISNPFFPLPVGAVWLLEGEEEDDEGELVEIRVQISSLDETEDVAGVTTRVIEEREWEDDELVEVSRNFFVQTSDGTVCYYGEDVDDYEDGEIVDHDGAWRAGVDGALPGILIPGDPQVGQRFKQEVAPGVAEDEAVQVAAGETVEVEIGTFTDTIRYEESSPLDDGTSEKIYARGVGMIVDDVIERVSAGVVELDDAEIRIEVNATDGDSGIQIFLDGENWEEMEITGPSGQEILLIAGRSSVGQIGLTELFIESAEPSFDDLPFDDFLALFPAGEYVFSGTTVDGEELVGEATLTHTIPDPPVLLTPEEDSVQDPDDTVVSWEPVEDPEDSEIVGYQVIVERDDPDRTLSADVSASVTSLTIPEEFLDPGTEYEFEVLAIEESGNQTISERPFMTSGSAADAGGAGETPEGEFDDAKIIFEINSTDEDGGIQIFIEAEGWAEVEVANPVGETIFEVGADGSVGDVGVTELFFESAEPNFDELSLDELLELFPEGEYQFTGKSVDGEDLNSTATLTHALPDGPMLLTPEEDSEPDPQNTVVSWEPVADPAGSQIVEYQVIVETDSDDIPHRVFSVHVPASVTSVTVPAEFMAASTEYKFEVLAIEASGNQTLTERSFETGIPDTVPDFEAAVFTNPTEIDNEFFPLRPGTVRTYLAVAEDEIETIVVEVTEETRDVAGVTTRVVSDLVFLEGLLIEDTDDWFAQDDDGNVWYMGEEVDNFEYDDDDNLISIDHEGAWEAGRDVADVGQIARPGYQMKASPMVGDIYHQEFYPGEAEDMAEVLAQGVPITLDDGTEYTTLQTRDFTPLEPGVDEHKYYAAGVGVVLEEKVDEDEKAELIATFQVGPETIPSFDAGDFTNPTQIDNPYFRLVPGTSWNYEVETEDGLETILVEVLEDTRVVAGISTRVVRDRVSLDGVLIEDTHDWYAQDDSGNVWYMGEEVDNYNYDDEGNLIDMDNDGAWEAGEDVADVGSIAIAGILMPANPIPGESYRQEYYPGEAEDMGYVVRLDATVKIDDEVICTDCLQTVDWNPLEPDALEYKFYARGIGVVLEVDLTDEEEVELTDFAAPGAGA